MSPAPPEPVGSLELSGAGGLIGVSGEAGGHVRLRLDISYDGTDFCGWARQPGLRSVQAELESALRAAVRIPVDLPARVAVAGRTDTGVHATGQVCHADVPRAAWAQLAGHGSISGAQIAHRRINGLLPADIRVRRLELAADGFHARWSASWRQYRYLVADRPAAQDPRTRGHVFWCRRELDVEAMAAAAVPFLGEHDFTAFCRARPGASSVRTVHEIGWSLAGHGGLRNGEPAVAPARQTGSVAVGPVQFTIRSDAFCHAMVRSLVGAFLEVGQGRWPQDRPGELLAAGVRVPAIPSAPARGLTLTGVGYPADEQLADQARTTRRYRGR